MAQNQAQLKQLQQMLGLVPGTGSKQVIKDAVFVCIDCEAFEHVQQMITEIGVAVLDTRDVADLDGDDNEEAWFAKMKYAHYRPVEYAHLRNKSFIKGCPEYFNFGSTTWVNLVDVKHVLKRAFRDPSQLQQAGDFSAPLADANRNVVYVAHGAKGDTAYMTQVGFTLAVDAAVSRTIDTQVLAAGSKRQAVGLRRLLLSLGQEPANLHNAGNDAAYTLQAFVLMALKDLAVPGSVPADLAKFRGKLPPSKQIPTVAPQLWAGTATRPDDSEPSSAQAVRDGPSKQIPTVAPQLWAGTATRPDDSEPSSVQAVRDGPPAGDKAERRRRKRVARAAHKVIGPAEDAYASQQPLPSVDRPGGGAAPQK
ncbi:hypothetical protein LTR36_006341 [Oleoguttula mirabilis]|uniref:Gfd2/YDR514C-like C-terminal domain-containing protein n=1 Tax=Oleoguttula mirabilis TaxID=1507867 RepID=A0AAV9JVK9_9PEZI|nr:hypothetical protein LTR36_006341 [Oleoguttula mirabilis]